MVGSEHCPSRRQRGGGAGAAGPRRPTHPGHGRRRDHVCRHLLSYAKGQGRRSRQSDTRLRLGGRRGILFCWWPKDGKSLIYATSSAPAAYVADSWQQQLSIPPRSFTKPLSQRPHHNGPTPTHPPSMQCVAAATVSSSGVTAAFRPKQQQPRLRTSKSATRTACSPPISSVASVVRPSSSGGTGTRRHAGSVPTLAALPAGRRARDVRARAEWDDDDLDKNGRPKNPNDMEAGPYYRQYSHWMTVGSHSDKSLSLPATAFIGNACLINVDQSASIGYTTAAAAARLDAAQGPYSSTFSAQLLSCSA